MGNGEYLRQDPHVNSDTMTAMPVDSEESGELLSDPATWIAASKKFPDSPSEDVKTQSPYWHCRRKAIASSDELQRQLSISNMSSPELDDNYSSGSWTTSEESLLDYAAGVGQSPRVPYYDDWNSWFPPERASQQILPVRGSSLSNIQHELTTHSQLILKDASCSTASFPQRALSKSHLRHPQLKKQASCIAFPQLAQKSSTHGSFPCPTPVKLHKSWPLEPKLTRPQLRGRANTTPQQQEINNSASSNLSTCISMDDVHSSRLTYSMISFPGYIIYANDHSRFVSR